MTTAHLDSREPPHAQTIRIGRHELISDEGAELGGHDAGPPPYGLLMAGLAACTSITLRMYADRKGWVLGPIHVDARFVKTGPEPADERVERVVKLQPEVPAEQRTRLAEIAEKTPVTKTLRRALTIVTRFE